jgi:hypothetical protein
MIQVTLFVAPKFSCEYDAAVMAVPAVMDDAAVPAVMDGMPKPNTPSALSTPSLPAEQNFIQATLLNTCS